MINSLLLLFIIHLRISVRLESNRNPSTDLVRDRFAGNFIIDNHIAEVQSYMNLK